VAAAQAVPEWLLHSSLRSIERGVSAAGRIAKQHSGVRLLLASGESARGSWRRAVAAGSGGA